MELQMDKRKLGAVLAVAVGWSLAGFTLPLGAQQLENRPPQLDTSLHIRMSDGNGLAETNRHYEAGANVTLLAKPNQVQTFSTTGRYLVRLKDQPLQPFVQNLKSRASVAGLSPQTMQAQLVTAAAQQKQRIQSVQNQVITTARSRRLFTQVHHQFRDLTNTLSVTLAPDALEAVRQLPQVAAVYPDSLPPMHLRYGQ
jgi:hypothetical protein